MRQELADTSIEIENTLPIKQERALVLKKNPITLLTSELFDLSVRFS